MIVISIKVIQASFYNSFIIPTVFEVKLGYKVPEIEYKTRRLLCKTKATDLTKEIVIHIKVVARSSEAN